MTTSIKIQSKSIASIIAASFALLGWVAAAGSAQAAEPIEAPTKVVNYGDLNLDTAAGAHTMYARLQAAATQVCSPLAGKTLSRHNNWQTCYDNALSAAVAQVNHAAVTALYTNGLAHSPTG